MLKPVQVDIAYHEAKQPPSGGCVLKQVDKEGNISTARQPPSGGCVLKLPRPPEALAQLPSRLQAAVC